MMPLTTPYDDYMERTKLTEQKNPFGYMFPPPNKIGHKNDGFAIKKMFVKKTQLKTKMKAE